MRVERVNIYTQERGTVWTNCSEDEAHEIAYFYNTDEPNQFWYVVRP